MKSIFQYTESKTYLMAKIASMPKQGYGQLSKLAKHLRVHTTFISQVFHGDKTFTLEHGLQIADYFGLNSSEKAYLLLLIQYDRASTPELRKHYYDELKRYCSQNTVLDERLHPKSGLTETQKAIYYSNWIYGAIQHLLLVFPDQQVPSICQYLSLSQERVINVIEFLLATGIIEQNSKGQYILGNRKPQLSPDSPWTNLYHLQWRQKAIANLTDVRFPSLHFTAPVVISRKQALEFRKQIMQFLAQINQLTDKTEPEAMYCFNLDWFRI